MNLKLHDIPWEKLTTPYGRGDEIPSLIEKKKYKELTELLEHQETLWQITPWSLYFLLEQLENDWKTNANEVSHEQLKMYFPVLTAYQNVIQYDFDSEEIYSSPEKLLDTEYLWENPEDDDDLYWEDEFPKGYDDISFLNLYYFSWFFINEKKELFTEIAKGSADIQTKAEAGKIYSELLKILKDSKKNID